MAESGHFAQEAACGTHVRFRPKADLTMNLLASMRMEIRMKWNVVLADVLIVVALCGPLYGFALERSYQMSLPRSPELKTGHVIPRNNHGVVVYYSEDEV